MQAAPEAYEPAQTKDCALQGRAHALPCRALLAGAVGVAVLCAITPYNDYHLHNTFLYGNHLPIGALCLFTLLAMGLNPLARRLVPRWAFSAGELLLIWAMLTCGAGLASSGLWRYLGPMVVAPAYFYGYGNRWLDGFAGAPKWLLLTNNPRSNAAYWFYHGLPAGQTVPWAAWLHVIAAWGTAFGLMVALSIGLCALFTRQWTHNERLTFPLTQLPIQMAVGDSADRPLFRERLFWTGVATVFTFHLLSTAHSLWPSIPPAPDRTDISSWQQTVPWNGLGLPDLEVYFEVIGVIFLLPTDISFTLWATFLSLHMFRVLRVSLGYDPLVTGPLDQEGAMGAGAFLFMAFWICWLARHHLTGIWRSVTQMRHPRQADEPLPMPIDLAVVLFGAGGLIIWMHLAGVSIAISALVVALMSIILLVLSRIMAEAGMPFLMTPFIPSDLMAFWGTGYYSATSASVIMITQVVFIHDPREHVMPAMTNAFALADRSRLRPQTFTIAIVVAIVIGFFVSFVSFVWLNYHYGAVTLDPYGTDGAPHWSLDRAVSYVQRPLGDNIGDLQALSCGVLLSALFAVMRARYLWWPLSPIGLAMGSTYAMNHIWFSVMLGWACKRVIVWAGGLKAYRGGLPYFLGLILGEGLFAGVSVLWGALSGAPTPQFMPN